MVKTGFVVLIVDLGDDIPWVDHVGILLGCEVPTVSITIGKQLMPALVLHVILSSPIVLERDRTAPSDPLESAQVASSLLTREECQLPKLAFVHVDLLLCVVVVRG